MKPKSKVLIIAGSDSSGGAGIQADIKTVTSLGSYAMTAITAVTAQNTTGVKSIVSISPKEISKQIDFSVKDIKPNAIKIGGGVSLKALVGRGTTDTDYRVLNNEVSTGLVQVTGKYDTNYALIGGHWNWEKTRSTLNMDMIAGIDLSWTNQTNNEMSQYFETKARSLYQLLLNSELGISHGDERKLKTRGYLGIAYQNLLNGNG